MKICWDNLEKLVYKNGRFYYNKNYTNRNMYVESNYKCKKCNEYFIDRKSLIENNKVYFCSLKCGNDSGTSLETKKKISKANKGEKSHLWKGGFCSNGFASYDQYRPSLELYHKVRGDNDILEVKCTYCGRWYKPTYDEVKSRKYSIEKGNGGGNYFYCSNICKKQCPIYYKSKYSENSKIFKPSTSREVQPELRKLVFERDNWTCIKCKEVKNLHCHHIDPVVNNPIESADINNCVTLCKNCHKEIHRKEGCKYNELRC